MPRAFNIPTRENVKLKRLIESVRRDTRLWTFWRCANVMAIDRMGYSDHGPTHVRIVANSALRILRMLVAHGVVPSIVKNYNMKNEDAEVVVVLGSIFHDLGMNVSRDVHDEFSALLSFEFLDKHLRPIYNEEERAIVTSEVLHALVTHERGRKPLTVEAGVVSVADALDMEEGRARIPFEAGKVGIHSVSALSIKQVKIEKGKEKPITIRILMADAAGVFQIDQLLKPRIEVSGLQDYIRVTAEVTGEKEKKILEKLEI